MDEHANLLIRLIKTGPIERVDGSSRPPTAVVEELVNEGLVKAIYASSCDGPCFLDVQITMHGRTWLEGRVKQAAETKSASSPDEDILDLKPNVMGIGFNLNALWRKWFGE